MLNDKFKFPKKKFALNILKEIYVIEITKETSLVNVLRQKSKLIK